MSTATESASASENSSSVNTSPGSPVRSLPDNYSTLPSSASSVNASLSAPLGNHNPKYQTNSAKGPSHPLSHPVADAQCAVVTTDDQESYRGFPDGLKVKYEVNRALGSGTFGRVYHCTHKATGIDYAVKVSRKCAQTRYSIKSEVALFEKQLNQPNLIDHKEIIQDNESIGIVVPLAQCDLLDFIEETCKFLYEDEAIIAIKQLLTGVAALHSQNIIHGDLKPENVLVFGNLEDNRIFPLLKVSDFGSVVDTGSNGPLVKEWCGTNHFSAPEVWTEIYDRRPFPGKHINGFLADTFSLGVILYSILTGEPPYLMENGDYPNREGLRAMILGGDFGKRQERWDEASAGARRVVTSMLNHDPSKRGTPADWLNDRWVNGLDEVEGREEGVVPIAEDEAKETNAREQGE